MLLSGGGWLPSDIRLDTGDAAGVNESMYPQICSIGSNVYAAWQDFRNGAVDIYFNYSTDGGATWQTPDIRLDTVDTPGASQSYFPQISSNGSNVYVVWEDERNGEYDIYFNMSSDNGASWLSTDVRLDTGDAAGAYDSNSPGIYSIGNNVYVVWSDYQDGDGDIYFNYSIDEGATWKATDIRLDTGDTAGANLSVEPKVNGSGDSIYAVWTDYRNGMRDIYFNTTSLPVIDIKANGSDGPITITQGEPLSVIVELDAGVQTGEDADW
jgi:hypothetical protein